MQCNNILRLTALVLVASSLLLMASDNGPDRIPSSVSWTSETIAAASAGDAFRGMLLARRCEHCHGTEGFSPTGFTPNLAGIDKLAAWKQLQDFRTGKRMSRAMGPIAASLSTRDLADVVVYYAKLPVFADSQDNRVFPRAHPEAAQQASALHMITFGDGKRGIPPCQACHGPVAYKQGAPSLMAQNSEYVLNQLEAFASRARTNDINMPMRTIAGLLTDNERKALAAYYGAGLGLPSGAWK